MRWDPLLEPLRRRDRGSRSGRRGKRAPRERVANARSEALGTYTDSVTGKPVANVTRYTYGDDDERYVVTFTRHRDLTRNQLVERLPWTKRAAARLVRFDGAYLRFSGEIRVQHYRGAEIVDQYATDDAIWELMYFGHARPGDV
jgi:hypothetical protein